MALNALLDTWATRNGNHITFDSDITDDVKTVISEGVYFLLANLDNMKELNAFFSGSMKIFNNSFPYFFPSNYALNKEGELVDPTKSKMKDIQFGSKVLVKGYIEPEKYECKNIFIQKC